MGRIYPLASRFLQKRARIFKYVVFFKIVFFVFLQIVFKRECSTGTMLYWDNNPILGRTV